MDKGRAALAGVVLLLAAVSFYVGERLPVDARVPIHWNAAGQIDGYGDKWTGLFIAPLMALITSLIFTAVTIGEPHQDNLQKSRALVTSVWCGVLGIAAVIEFAQVSTLFGWPVPVARLVVGGIGLFFLVIGNQLSKSRQMYMVGIRTPWTLADPDIWIATHRRHNRSSASDDCASAYFFRVTSSALSGAPRPPCPGCPRAPSTAKAPATTRRTSSTTRCSAHARSRPRARTAAGSSR